MPAGWYPTAVDPAGVKRYWDGTRWTEHLNGAEATIDLRHEPEVAPGPVVPEPASAKKRIIARFIDRSILSFGRGWILVVSMVGLNFSVAVSIAGLVGWVALDTVFVARLGGTPGKLLLGLVVVDNESGSEVEMDQAFRRGVLGVVPGSIWILAWFNLAPLAVVLWLGIGAVSLVQLFVGQHRTVHDRVGGTRVIERDQMVSSTP